MTCTSPLKARYNGVRVSFDADPSRGEPLDLACGQCMGCRLARANMWAIRITCEAQMHEQNTWITLTYDPEHLPHGGTLLKADFQKFMKRLRHRIQPIRVRYYACGEYGDQLQRPHYHACLFGFQFPDMELVKRTNHGPVYLSPMLADIWGKGFASVADLTYESAAYTARYTMKKITGLAADNHYSTIDEHGQLHQLEPEFSLMSLKPGIGEKWYKKFSTDIHTRDQAPILGHRPRITKRVPDYFDKLLERVDPTQYQRIKEERKQYRETHATEYTRSRLKAKAAVTAAKAKLLIRELHT